MNKKNTVFSVLWSTFLQVCQKGCINVLGPNLTTSITPSVVENTTVVFVVNFVLSLAVKAF